ncbi:probable proline--tRNA ligase, mitochondrial [Bufo gargarizans]|uniref:probable proline--tRNA ligase, mitochondrial n=1 Tax=Bufo gargarizans TaxID=30331 RepID=UPI001CF163B0|nr:probable proline--tRNA ligase, mitochondrial [Bufo gargarizans]XP_044157414.1 probable proline--tRNA ligase, mitochondrial [Bufo gargarizans]
MMRTLLRSSLPHLVVSRAHYNDTSKIKRLLLSRIYQPGNLWKENSPDIQAKSNEPTSKSQRLMFKAGLIRPTSPGCFHYLPHTVRSMEKLVRLIDRAMQEIGGQKIDMATLCSAALWRQSGRWDLVGKELLCLVDRHNQEYCLGPTHEEYVTSLVATEGGISYKQLPLLLYQITRKFRDEKRPCFGLLRGREFYMKDMYTFDITEEAAYRTYNSVCDAYANIFRTLGLKHVKVQADTGNIGGKMSHEFHLPASIGEDKLMVCGSCDFAANVETLYPDDKSCPSCKGELAESKGIEIGHTFYLGTKYSHVFNAVCLDAQNKPVVAEMGCYGIGVSRLLAASLEVLSTEEDIHWPGLISPYQICLIPPKKGSKETAASLVAEELYDSISAVPHMSNEAVLDDRDHLTIGKRVKEAHMMGYPYIIVIGKKALESPPVFEVQNHRTGEVQFLSKEGVLSFIQEVRVI